MTFRTLLFADQQAREEETPQPGYFGDLFLDQIVASVTAGREQFRLRPLFHRSLRNAEDVTFRQAIVGDLQKPAVRSAVDTFAAAMETMRKALARGEKHRHPLQKQHRTLEAVDAYCAGLVGLRGDLEAAQPSSEGLRNCQSHLDTLIASEGFTALLQRSRDVAAELSAIRYSILIDGLRVRIDRFEGDDDYGAAIRDSYARFDQGSSERFQFRDDASEDLNMIEERILDQVARAFAEPFAALAAFAGDPGPAFLDEVVGRVDREAQFYLAFLDHIRPMEEAGLPFCLPDVVDAKDVRADDGFDLALAHLLVRGDGSVIPNSFELNDGERIIVVSGPNQGGKTTFARMFGQIHHLGCLGLPVPGRSARLHLFDTILTHFERSEVAGSLHGKLQDELVRLHTIVEAATSDSIIILNELFASTTFRDAYALSERISAQLRDRDLICVWVSFLDRLSTLSDTMVSMVSTVDPDDPTRRTFRVERREADNLAYARALATKYALTHDQLDSRLGR
jgi:DNA mismatch repair protein MutS